ncbi:hypothetical protein AAC387_Pa04g2854 [Persea americana]
MGRVGRLGFLPKSLLQIHRRFLSTIVPDSHCVVDRRYRYGGISSLLRAVAYAPTLYGCDTDAFQKPAKFSSLGVLLVKRHFHASGSSYATERDLYEILGVPKDASQDEIKKSFHALAKKYHPDANKNNPAAKRKFQEIRDAYETLRDPKTRAQYDAQLKVHVRSAEKGEHVANDSRGFSYAYEDSFSDSFHKIFSEIFEDETETFADDIQVEISLSFSEAAKGCTKHLSFDAEVPCDSCNGSGHPINARPKVCPMCKGVGRVTLPPFTSTCGACKGFGRIIKDNCLVCKGHGVVEGIKEVNITIPAGVDSGDTIRVPKAGNSGRRGGHPGNLIIRLKVAKDPVFVRDGADIYVDSHMSFTKAMLGGKVDVPTLSGTTQIKIPNGVQPGQLLVLRGKGLPKHSGLFDRGDQYVRFRIHFPSSVNEKQQTLLEEFAREELFYENSSSAKDNWWQHIVDQLAGSRFMQLAVLILILLLLNRTMI